VEVPVPRQVKYSVLDLSPIVQGGTAADSFRNSRDLAQHAEKWKYHRYWLAEHHNIAGIASAATSVVIAHIAQATKTIRVGSGGIMLPNHAPLLIAEQFGTLEALFPGRIDLGLGRAPGGDIQTAHAIRRTLGSSGDTFERDLQELRAYLGDPAPDQVVRAVPGQRSNVPIYLLGSSDFSANLAADLGLPFAFASHFAPDYLTVALASYRRQFQPSDALKQPYVIVGVNVFAADTDRAGQRLFTSLQQAFVNLVRGVPGELQPPVDAMQWSPMERSHIERMLQYSAVGSPETVKRKLQSILDATDADELILTSQAYDHAARLRSFEIAAKVMREINAR
jgi:luciferase family oxidoreductase group 1